MMKAKDVSVATALLIGGYLRSNVDNGEEAKPDENKHLADCLNAINLEVSDWAENLATDDQAIEPDSLTVDVKFNGCRAPRSPYTLVSAAIALLHEAHDVGGGGALLEFVARYREGLELGTDTDRPFYAALAEASATRQ